MRNEMWLVIHIPKTAGTSLRWALEKQFGQSQVVRDYGPASKHSSEIVQKYLFEELQSSASAELIKEMSDRGSKVLTGHFPLKRYARFFEPKNIITFVRNPLVRTCSEYLHTTNNETFEGSLSEFIQRPGHQNLQTRFLEGISEKSLIGITEKYHESLKLINAATQWNILTRKKNIGRGGGGRKLAGNLSTHELDLFYRMNQNDLELYQKAKQRFDTFKIPSSKGERFLNLFKHSLHSTFHHGELL